MCLLPVEDKQQEVELPVRDAFRHLFRDSSWWQRETEGRPWSSSTVMPLMDGHPTICNHSMTSSSISCSDGFSCSSQLVEGRKRRRVAMAGCLCSLFDQQRGVGWRRRSMAGSLSLAR